MKRFWLWTINLIVVLLGVILVAVSLNTNFQILDLLSDGRLIYAGILFCAFICLLGLNRRTQALFAAGLTLFALWPIVGLYSFATKCSNSRTSTVRILAVNIGADHNKNYERLMKFVQEEQPDIIGISEVTKDWRTALTSELQVRYPFFYIQESCGGMALFSRYRLNSSQISRTDQIERPRIQTVVDMRGEPVTMILAHLATPQNPSFKLRQDDFTQLAAEVKNIAGPTILFGDFNCCQWSSLFQRLVENTHLVDTSAGFGIQPTWCQSPWFLLFPIDQVLISQEFCTCGRCVGKDVGSDHLPLIVDVYLKPTNSPK